jgi:hypothetical protein
MRGFIDPPTPFSPTKSWEDFLAQMKQLPRDDPDVQREVKRAEQELSERKKGSQRKTKELTHDDIDELIDIEFNNEIISKEKRKLLHDDVRKLSNVIFSEQNSKYPIEVRFTPTLILKGRHLGWSSGQLAIEAYKAAGGSDLDEFIRSIPRRKIREEQHVEGQTDPLPRVVSEPTRSLEKRSGPMSASSAVGPVTLDFSEPRMRREARGFLSNLIGRKLSREKIIEKAYRMLGEMLFQSVEEGWSFSDFVSNNYITFSRSAVSVSPSLKAVQSVKDVICWIKLSEIASLKAVRPPMFGPVPAVPQEIMMAAVEIAQRLTQES